MTLAAVAMLLACTPEPEDTDTDAIEHTFETFGMLDVERYATRTDAAGTLVVDVVVDEETTGFMVVGTSPSDRVAFDAVHGPDGELLYGWEEWYYGTEILTDASWAFRRTMGLNWPIRPDDPPLEPGTYRVTLGTFDQPRTPSGDQTVDVAILTKRDPDPSTATVRVRLVYAAGLADDPVVTDGVDRAVEVWRALWAPHGLTLELTTHTSDLDPTLGFVANGGSDVAAVADEIADPGELVVVVGDYVGSKPIVYGTAPSAPVAPIASDYAWIAIAYGNLAGADGAVDAFEERLFGTTLAHEVSHAMGLSHVVDAEWGTFDALGDTGTCYSEYECELHLGDNLMFPYCLGNDCSGVSYTADQVAVLHGYIGAL